MTLSARMRVVILMNDMRKQQRALEIQSLVEESLHLTFLGKENVSEKVPPLGER